MQTVKFKISRYDPQAGKNYWDEHTLPFHKDLTVLEALNRIKGEKSHSLAFRQSCGMGICGSCGAVVNGKHVLMCQAFCRDLKQPIVIEPLKNFPVIKDLVVDIEKPMEHLRKVMPHTRTQLQKTHGKEHLLQSPAQRKKIEQASQCIKCMLCYSACPVYGLKNNFIGPAALTSAYRYNHDSRDRLKEKRFEKITKEDGVYNCSFVGECSYVCPKKVDPAAAIQKLKVAGVFHTIKNIKP